MSSPKTVKVKYVYLDVVGFTRKDRSASTQKKIILTLNKIVKKSLTDVGIMVPDERMILLPTGDGLCIGFIKFDEFDIHMRVAQKLLDHLEQANIKVREKVTKPAERKALKFKIRIGINENDDFQIQDINGHNNVTGAGVNYAQRVMSLGDEGHILVSRSVYDSVQPHDPYLSSFSEQIIGTLKDGRPIEVYQYVDKKVPGLNKNPPAWTIAQQQLPAQQSMIIDSAIYGQKDKFKDVTDRLRRLVEEGRLTLEVGPRILGDPVPSEHKELLVKYRYGGSERTQLFEEAEVVNLP